MTGVIAAAARKVAVYVDDKALAESVRRQAHKLGLGVTSCYNLSDLTQVLACERPTLAGLVLDHRLVGAVTQGSAYRRLGALPVIVTGVRPTVRELPFANARYVATGRGAGAIMRALQ